MNVEVLHSFQHRPHRPAVDKLGLGIAPSAVLLALGNVADPAHDAAHHRAVGLHKDRSGSQRRGQSVDIQIFGQARWTTGLKWSVLMILARSSRNQDAKRDAYPSR